jgi:hypothetical protein
VVQRRHPQGTYIRSFYISRPELEILICQHFSHLLVVLCSLSSLSLGLAEDLPASAEHLSREAPSRRRFRVGGRSAVSNEV